MITSAKIGAKEAPEKLHTKWKQLAITVAGGNDLGRNYNQLSFPQGLFIDEDHHVYVADWWNNRIMEWINEVSTGRIVAGVSENGNQLNHPTAVIVDKVTNSLIIADCENGRVIRASRENNICEEVLISDIDCVNLAMDKDGSLYVSNCVKNEVRRWRKGEIDGTIVAGGHGKGDRLNQLDCPSFIFIAEDYSLYVSDMNNHRVVKWTKDADEGVVVAGGNGNGCRLTQLSFPEGLVIDHVGQVYVADSLNHRVMRWREGYKEGAIVVGGHGQGRQADQLNSPIDLSFDRQGNLYVVDCWNHRVQKFEIEYYEHD